MIGDLKLKSECLNALRPKGLGGFLPPPKNVFGLEKWNVGHRLKRMFSKFEVKRSNIFEVKIGQKSYNGNHTVAKVLDLPCTVHGKKFLT